MSSWHMASKSLTASMAVSANLWFWGGSPALICLQQSGCGLSKSWMDSFRNFLRAYNHSGAYEYTIERMHYFVGTQTTSSILLLLDFSVSGLWIIVNYHRNPNNNDRDLVEQSTEDIVCIWVQAGGHIWQCSCPHPIHWQVLRGPPSVLDFIWVTLGTGM